MEVQANEPEPGDRAVQPAQKSSAWSINQVRDVLALAVTGVPLLAVSFGSCYAGWALFFCPLEDKSRMQLVDGLKTLDEHWRATLLILLPVVLPSLARLARRLKSTPHMDLNDDDSTANPAGTGGAL